MAAGWLALEDECARVVAARAALQAVALRDNDAAFWADAGDEEEGDDALEPYA